MSTEDGPGLRTTVFLKGCSLACRWCHNPESIASFPELQWVGSRCIGCRSCLEVCPLEALSMTPEGIAIDRGLCDGCGICVETCPSTALELLGTRREAKALALELAHDEAYFRRSGGGVTISGGEPTLQSAFVVELSSALREMGIHVAVDTCGHCVRRPLLELLEHADLLLYDVKVVDPIDHKRLTGQDNQRVFENLEAVANHPRVVDGTTKLWIRTPLIPGDTDSEMNIKAIATRLASFDSIERWELCAFNNLCKDKYARLERFWPYEEAELLAASNMDRLVAIAVEQGIPADVVAWTGSAKRGDLKPQEG